MADEKQITTAVEETAVQSAEVPTEIESVPAQAEEAAAAEAVEEVPAQAEEGAAAEAVEETPAQTEETAAAEAVEETSAQAEKNEATAAEAASSAKPQKTAKDSVLTAIGVLLCLILAPILIANMTMIIKSYTNADEVPSFGGYCPFIVMTDSMSPVINGGDLVIDKVVSDPSEIQKGDIISFFDPASSSNSVVTHRVVEVVKEAEGISFRTQGDANNTEDDDLVPADKVVGVYLTKISGAGNVILFMQSTPGLVVCIALPILLLIGYDAIRRRRYEKQQQADTEALMKERAERFKEAGDYAREKEYSQIYRGIIELLDEIYELIGEEKISAADYLELLETGLDEIRLGTLPQKVDRVLCGDVERTRFGEVKVLFFVGINDGNIPRSTGGGGLISDLDREFLESSGLELAPSPREQMYIQRLYLYLNMTKATDMLCLSYARVSMDGQSITGCGPAVRKSRIPSCRSRDGGTPNPCWRSSCAAMPTGKRKIRSSWTPSSPCTPIAAAWTRKRHRT